MQIVILNQPQFLTYNYEVPKGTISNSQTHYKAAEETTGTSVDTGKNADARRSSFDIMAASAFARESAPRLAPLPSIQRKTFDISSWTKKTDGGLGDADRRLLGELYGSAKSVFEWGLGESTYIAAEVGVLRYGGIDSDSKWVTNARDQSPDHFRFFLGDVGPTGAWGQPSKPRLPKSVVNYQVAPLLAEEKPFELYMVDGRWRLPCALVAFLHASAKGTTPSERSPKVLIHDYSRHESIDRKIYRRIEEVAELVTHSGGMLAVFQRKMDVTDEDILRLWNEVLLELG